VKYLIIGSIAFAFHARPRATKGIDFLIESSPKNAEKMMKVLSDFGFGNIGIEKNDFLNLDNVIQLGYPPIRIDILVSIGNLEFQDLWENRVVGKYGDQKANFISFDGLILIKKIAGRPQDLVDIGVLEEFKSKIK
jgi:hypothetical protein